MAFWDSMRHSLDTNQGGGFYNLMDTISGGALSNLDRQNQRAIQVSNQRYNTITGLSRNNAKNNTTAKYIPQDNSALNAELAALRAQIAAQPVLPSFDILGNYNRAKKTAEKNQKKYYNDLWAKKVNQWNAQTQTRKSQRDLGYETNTMANRYTKEDNQTTRTRTAEDVASAIEQINRGETDFQSDEGTQFDAERRALQENVAASGLTGSGLGQQAIGDQVDMRNIASDRQVVEFENQRQAKELFKNRTFEDMARGDVRADEKRALDDKGVKLDYENYLNELAAEKKSARLGWEADLMGAIINETQQLSNQGIQQFLASLPGQGHRAQDIQYANDFYGRML